jgi:dTDP-4-dehydrorhamnose reductase
MKKILIMGATGMAGHVIHEHLVGLGRYRIVNTCFREKLNPESQILDVHDEQKTRCIIAEEKPDYVINCIGVLVRGSRRSLENCIYVNAYYPHLLSRIMQETLPGSHLIHISTDCVFSGDKGPYVDTARKDALDAYGMTKNLGEVLNAHDLTVRTSIIGPELKKNGEGLFHWLFTQERSESIHGYAKSIWSGVTTLELAKFIDSAISSGLVGLYQLSNNIRISKYELITLIADIFGMNMSIEKVDGVVQDKSIIQSQRDGFSYAVPSYSDMLSDLFVYMKKRRELYAGYLEGIA